MSTGNNEFADMFESVWEDEEVIFEAKAQDVAIELASAVERAGLSRSELAKQLDWKPSRVTKVLTGNANLTLKTIFQVCQAIGLEFDVVLRKAHERAEVVDQHKHQVMHEEVISNLHKSRQLLEAAASLHRKASQRALDTRNYRHEEARLTLVA